MYKIIILLALALSVFYTVDAQTREIDEIHVVGDTSFRGRVIEQKPGDYIRLKVEATGDTLTFSMDEIEKLVRIPVKEELPESTADDGQTTIAEIHPRFNNNRFSLSLYGAVGGGDVAYQGLGVGFQYRVTDRIAIGLSANYFGESSSSTRRPYQWQKIPVSLDVNYDLQRHFHHRSAIYAHLGLGYAFTLNGEYSSPDTGDNRTITNGLYVNPGLGYRVNLFQNTGLTLEVSYVLVTDKIEDEASVVIQKNQWDNIKFSASIFF